MAQFTATSAPAGWRLVPEQWTTEMAHAGYEVHKNDKIACYECGQIYTAMLAAAPKYGPGAMAPSDVIDHELLEKITDMRYSNEWVGNVIRARLATTDDGAKTA